MYVLQRTQNASITFTDFPYRADLLADVRSNYGLNESEFWEFIAEGFFERDHIFLGWFYGEIPQQDNSPLTLRAQKAAERQAAAMLAKKG